MKSVQKKTQPVWVFAVRKRNQSNPHMHTDRFNKPSYFLFQDFASKNKLINNHIVR